MDLISRQAAIDALAKTMPTMTTPDGSGECDRGIYIADEAFADAIRIIKELPSADISARVSKALSKEETERFRKAMKNARVGLLPSVEPQIIRCKDCRYYEGDNDFCRMHDDSRNWNDFCGEGES